MLKLFAWSKDFNPKLQHNTSAQIWVKFFGLSQEYWHKSILFTIASSLGTPICTDAVTARPMHERTFGQFARVLVDMDLSQPLRYKVLVERKGFAFFLDIEYENVPDFCDACHVIGHHVEVCKRWNKDDGAKPDKENLTKKKPINEPKQVYVPVKDVRPQQNKDNEVINVDRVTVDVENNTADPPANNIVQLGTVLASQEPVNVLQHLPVIVPVVDAILTPVETFKAQDKQIEDDLNTVRVDDDDDTLSGSDSSASFVDATQNQITTASASTASPEQSSTPDRIVKDMEFLKNSWANMAEEEENQLVVDAAVQAAHQDPDEGFTVSMSKHQKKVQRKKIHSSKDSYATRSKVPSKPFK
jgi:hypothetical protein